MAGVATTYTLAWAALMAPPAPLPAVPPPAVGRPPTLGQALQSVGAFDAPITGPSVETLLAPAPPPARPLAITLLAVGGASAVAGLVGTLVTPTCSTRDADLRCVDRRGPHWAFPSLIGLGLGAMISGFYWYRQDLSEAEADPPLFDKPFHQPPFDR